ncbi:hypothetical protein KY285_030919 [Solanum tuberosum]|nr:hypothetical protein KY285_030919 [Solanum tuberosum]
MVMVSKYRIFNELAAMFREALLFMMSEQQIKSSSGATENSICAQPRTNHQPYFIPILNSSVPRH